MRPARLVAAGFGTGFSPAAPGTAGSVLGLAIGVALLALSPWLLAAAALVVSLGGVAMVSAATGMKLRHTGKGEHDDPGWVVIDEVAGQMLALLGLPHPSWGGALLAFALFRLLDIAKPGPIGWADRRGGALGVMLDDVLAGIAAAALVAAAHHVWPRFA